MDSTWTHFQPLLMVCLVLYVVIFYVIDRLPVNIRNIQYLCLSGCESDTCQNITRSLRDSDYWLDPKAKTIMDPVRCKATLYELTHLLLHVWVGYYYDLTTSIALSVAFELFEHAFYNCGSVLDLIWNLAGGICGTQLHRFAGRY